MAGGEIVINNGSVAGLPNQIAGVAADISSSTRTNMFTSLSSLFAKSGVVFPVKFSNQFASDTIPKGTWIGLLHQKKVT